MKRVIFVLAAIFVTTLAVTFAFRMTSDAMAVIVGIILGMLATIPTSLVLLYMIRQRDQQPVDPRQQSYGSGQYPPVVVVNSSPNGGYGGMTSANPQNYLPAPMGERSFTVVGQEASPDGAGSERSGFNRIFDEIT